MGETLYLLESRARKDYTCPGCGHQITAGSLHFRHTPHPAAWIHRGRRGSHWCHACICAATPEPKEHVTGRVRVPALRVAGPSFTNSIQPLRVELVGIGQVLCEKLLTGPELVHSITPEQFEEFVCDRLFAMGLEPQRVGSTNQKDGGIDVLFWPRQKNAFPFLGAAQVKHHRNLKAKVGPAPIREFQGVIGSHPISAGLIVTNTSFTSDARWFASEHARLIRLRDYGDMRRWMLGQFGDEEWRELPNSIELCPGVVIKIR